MVLVGHSGAGALLPSIRQEVGRPVAAYVFVDSLLPREEDTRLGEGAFAEQLRRLYAQGGRFPDWTDESLKSILPDPVVRVDLLASVRPQPWEFREENIPVFEGWPDAPCAYLRFVPNGAYDESAAEAQRLGWRYRELGGGHFHMLVAPTAVAEALLDLAQ